MGKYKVLLLSVVIIMSITACGKAPDSPKALPTALELITETSKASLALKSFTMDLQMNQDIVITSGETNQSQNIKMDMKSDIINEPMEIHQEINMSMPGATEAQHVNQYIMQEGIYTQAQGVWTKLPDDQKDQLLAAALEQAKPEKQLEHFKTITKDTKISKDGNNYILSADVSGDNVKELAKSFLAASGSSTPEMTELMGKMNFTSIKMTYMIDQNNYLPVHMNVDMVMDMELQGEKMAMNIKMESSFSNHNKVAEIKVPQEALDAVKQGSL
jgi:hypothetical protein